VVVFCTVVTRSHLGWAAAMVSSLREAGDSSPVNVAVTDVHNSTEAEHDWLQVAPDLANVHCFAGNDLGIDSWEYQSFQYSAPELCCAVKPWIIRKALAQGASLVVYLDADICIYRVFDYAAALEQSSIGLTPHRLTIQSLDDGGDELSLLQAGIFNAGCVVVRAGTDGESFLEWWATRLKTQCIFDRPTARCVDQSWLSFVPALWPSCRILRHTGLNVAYWNWLERSVRWDSVHGWLAGDEPLVFAHFSGFQPQRPQRLSMFASDAQVPLSVSQQRLLEGYWQRLKSYLDRTPPNATYRFAHLPDGTAIENVWRESVRLALVAERLTVDPWQCSREDLDRLTVAARDFQSLPHARTPRPGQATPAPSVLRRIVSRWNTYWHQWSPTNGQRQAF
jgi:hypothetical protein